jgi:hypothetical protein
MTHLPPPPTLSITSQRKSPQHTGLGGRFQVLSTEGGLVLPVLTELTSLYCHLPVV